MEPLQRIYRNESAWIHFFFFFSKIRIDEKDLTFIVKSGILGVDYWNME